MSGGVTVDNSFLKASFRYKPGRLGSLRLRDAARMDLSPDYQASLSYIFLNNAEAASATPGPG